MRDIQYYKELGTLTDEQISRASYGIESGLTDKQIELILNLDFDYAQVIAIAKGLRINKSAILYAKPEMSSYVMDMFLLFLESGLDIYSAASEYEKGELTGCKLYALLRWRQAGASKYASLEIKNIRCTMDSRVVVDEMLEKVRENIKKSKIINCSSHSVVIHEMEDGAYRFSVGCQDMMTKESFIARIHNTDGGLKENPHRQEYLELLKHY